MRKPSDKPTWGQEGHPGSTLRLSPTSDEVIVHVMEQCAHRQQDLRAVENLAVERRQVIDLPSKRLAVVDHQAERRKQPSARNLLDRLCTDQEAVFVFWRTSLSPLTGILAECDIRIVIVQQKVSGCFRSLPGAQAFCRIRSYLSTLRKQGIPVLEALEQALAGQSVFPAFWPSLRVTLLSK